MSGLDDGHHDNHSEHFSGENIESPSVSGPPRLKVRRSMDLEFHDLQLDDSDESEHSQNSNKGMAFLRKELRRDRGHEDDSSCFDDSFGEASDDEEPDKQYLEELLDETCHPERLNLLDNAVSPRKEKPQLHRSSGKNGFMAVKYDVSDSDSDQDKIEHTTEDDESDWTPTRSGAHSDTSSEIQQQDYAYDLSDHSDSPDDPSPEIVLWNPCDHVDVDEGVSADDELEPRDEDAFINSPTRRIDPARPSIRKQMERMGKSTKKSFRTVGNQTFFSQAFKGLTKTIPGDKRKPRTALEQKTVA